RLVAPLPTIIEIRPFRNGWKCFEVSGVEPVFLDQAQALTTPLAAHVFAPVKFGFWMREAMSNAPFGSMMSIEKYRAIKPYKSGWLFGHSRLGSACGKKLILPTKS